MKSANEEHVSKAMRFDVDDDPGERRNLAYRCPEVLAELQGAYPSQESRLDG